MRERLGGAGLPTLNEKMPARGLSICLPEVLPIPTT